jgi:MoaA/NifB/PqqE/SkfB family radical SAM enzyme
MPARRLAHDRTLRELAIELGDELRNGIRRTRPTRMTMHITELCDARCVMCNLWQTKKTDELSTEDYDRLFADPFFARVRRAVITGGEATIRRDLARLVAILESRLPRLVRITIATNALNPKRLAERLDEIVATKVRPDVEILFQISLDGVGGVHEAVRGTPRAFERVQESVALIEGARDRTGWFNLAFGCVMQEANIDGAYDLYAWFRERNYDFVYTMVTESDGYYRTGAIDVRRRDAALRAKIHAFYRFLLARETNPGKRLLFADMVRLLEGGTQRRACPMLRDTVSIDPKGNFLPCVQAYERKYGNVAEATPAAVWTGVRARAVIDDLRRNQCPTCTSACGVSYAAIAREELRARLPGRRAAA